MLGSGLITVKGPLRVFVLPHDARPLLLNVGQPGDCESPYRLTDPVRLIDASYKDSGSCFVVALFLACPASLVSMTLVAESVALTVLECM